MATLVGTIDSLTGETISGVIDLNQGGSGVCAPTVVTLDLGQMVYNPPPVLNGSVTIHFGGGQSPFISSQTGLIGAICVSPFTLDDCHAIVREASSWDSTFSGTLTNTGTHTFTMRFMLVTGINSGNPGYTTILASQDIFFGIGATHSFDVSAQGTLLLGDTFLIGATTLVVSGSDGGTSGADTHVTNQYT